jgi:hypothetical protein
MSKIKEEEEKAASQLRVIKSNASAFERLFKVNIEASAVYCVKQKMTDWRSLRR